MFIIALIAKRNLDRFSRFCTDYVTGSLDISGHAVSPQNCRSCFIRHLANNKHGPQIGRCDYVFFPAELGPHLTQCDRAKFRLDPPNRLTATHQRYRQDRQAGQDNGPTALGERFHKRSTKNWPVCNQVSRRQSCGSKTCKNITLVALQLQR